MATEDDEPKPVYHERQSRQFCLLHSLNNLYQQKGRFTRQILNDISDTLALRESEKKNYWNPLSLVFKPHHNVITGNYDVNVLIAALEGDGKAVTWHDNRNKASTIDLEEEALMGIVLNISVKSYAGIRTSRHWVTVRKIDGVWYDLDSDFDAPRAFTSTKRVGVFLDSILENGGEVLLVKDNSNR